MEEAFIVDVIRTAGGRRGGRLSEWHPADLGGFVVDALLDRTGADPELIDDVIFGCVQQVGQQSQNVARTVALSSRLPERVPGVTIDRQCGSSQQAIHFAAQAVLSGTMDMVIAGGVESMTRVPMLLASTLPEANGMGHYRGTRFEARYGTAEPSQFDGAEQMAERFELSKDELDRFALESHRRAAAAAAAGAFDDEIAPIPVQAADGSVEWHQTDEGIRTDATLDGIQKVKLLREGGRISAANASQICDGASAALIVNRRGLAALGRKPIGRIHQMAVTGSDPVIMLDAPIPATRRALGKAGLKESDIALFEVNEAFASVPMGWMKALDIDPGKVNVHGGAIALGHPLGASGTRILATLLNALARRGQRFGLQTMCEGGGLANATIVENLRI
ncbi:MULTISPECIES: acetyl-CoA C-acetyltransferase [unclassified Sphingomonas]|uniref:acetyl-CoA C-acetyltransferase n=1 Tax=unclassified Sphingomonas TaxID=196159 RepID=UPI0006FD23A8|nr:MULTISPECIES: acetyl-CoA C-acetyltransferase [unclassified Sphingomonas]KQX23221.1 acetyl-CoA acetyltransferase [Sphingomonas sp. Root1294]KQY68069.1 acetyl-CoA acetyltransferase [Sphingomonas sp. Root50]KRB90960.1 acetyl-CoA acetyltransferase [Sphingomonas sp. Root720]